MFWIRGPIGHVLDPIPFAQVKLQARGPDPRPDELDVWREAADLIAEITQKGARGARVWKSMKLMLRFLILFFCFLTVS